MSITEVIDYLMILVIAWVGYVHKKISSQEKDHHHLSIKLAENHPTKEDIRDLRESINNLKDVVNQLVGRLGNGR